MSASPRFAENAPLEAALEYAAAGLRVLPCHGIFSGVCACGDPECDSPGKHPIGEIVPKGVSDATTDARKIRAWWRRFPEANVGVAMGAGIVGLDLDHATRGIEYLADLAKAHGGLPATLSVRSGSGARHVYFRSTIATATLKEKGADGRPTGRALTLRGEGYYFIAPPSANAKGPYTWESDAPLSAIPPLPGWLEDLCAAERTAGHDWPAELVTIPKDRRRPTLCNYAAKLANDGLPGPAVEAALRALNETSCDPPLDAHEFRDVERAAKSAVEKFGRPIEAQTPAGIRFWTVAELFAETEKEISWVVEPFLARGAVTAIEGKPKLGKTTFAYEMLRSILRGREFLGYRTRKSPVVLFTEHGKRLSRLTLERAGIDPSDEGLEVVHFAEVRRLPWERIVEEAVARAADRGALLYFDTLGRFARVKDRNDASEADAAYEPLLEAASQRDLAIGATRHARKSGGAIEDVGGGSNAYAGAVDVLVAFRRPKKKDAPKTVREIEIVSRLALPTEDLRVDFDGATGYHLAGDFDPPGAAEKREERAAQALERLWKLGARSKETAVKTDAWENRAGLGHDGFDAARAALREAGDVDCVKKGTATLWWVVPRQVEL